MSTDPMQAASEPGVGEPSGQPSEEELRAAYEAEISRVTSSDMILQSVVSLLNVGGHRLGLSAQGETAAQEPARDLEQVRDAIDGARALMPILERREPAENLRPLRDALSQLQMAYTREVGASAPPAERAPGADRAPAGPPPTQAPPPAAGEKPAGPGPAQSSGRLWVPGQ